LLPLDISDARVMQPSKQVAFIKSVSIAHRCTIEKVHTTKYIKNTKKYIQSHDNT